MQFIAWYKVFQVRLANLKIVCPFIVSFSIFNMTHSSMIDDFMCPKANRVQIQRHSQLSGFGHVDYYPGERSHGFSRPCDLFSSVFCHRQLFFVQIEQGTRTVRRLQKLPTKGLTKSEQQKHHNNDQLPFLVVVSKLRQRIATSNQVWWSHFVLFRGLCCHEEHAR